MPGRTTEDEVLALRHELLRLRDELAGQQAELATAAARAEELADVVSRYNGIRGHVRAIGSIATARLRSGARRLLGAARRSRGRGGDGAGG
jgi:hypothetical protein